MNPDRQDFDLDCAALAISLGAALVAAVLINTMTGAL